MSWPASISTPSRWRASRFSAAASVSASSTRPPGNSHRSGSTAVGRRWVMRYRPSRSITAATTRIVRNVGSIRLLLHVHAEQLLAHQEDVAVDDLDLGLEADEAAVRAPQVGEVDLVALVGEPA